MKLERFRDRFFEGAPRYRFLETIGRGGMGVVFKAHDLDLDEVVAIKVLSPDLESDDSELLARFKREINLNRKIKHPNVARIHDFGTSGDYPYITMEFIPGKELRTLIQDEGGMGIAPSRAISILRQIALGTHAAHKLDIIHRDLKSPNIIVDDSGAVAILDFGLARLARGKTDNNLTVDSVVVGTPHYLSPEQALGKEVTARSDIYSLGIIAFEILTGSVPFTGDSPIAIAMKHVSEPVPDTLSLHSDVPAELVEIVHRCLCKKPEDRYATAADLEAELAAVQLQTRAAEEGKRKSGETRRPFPLPADAARPAPNFLAERSTETPSAAFRTIPASDPRARAAVSDEAARRAAAAPVSPSAAAPPAAPPGPVPAPVKDEASFADLGVADAAAEPFPEATTTGSFRVPSPVEPPRPPVTTPPPAAIDRAPIILVVDGQPLDRTLTSAALARFGWQIVESRSGPEALETLMNKPIDLVVMDAQLPGMDGFDVTRIIKSQPNLSALPVILTSPRVDRGQFAFAIQSGAADFLGKPVQPESLAARVWKLLQHRGFRSNEADAVLKVALDAGTRDVALETGPIRAAR